MYERSKVVPKRRGRDDSAKKTLRLKIRAPHVVIVNGVSNPYDFWSILIL